MTNVGLIGFGKWGKILAKKLSNVANLKFICNSKDDYTLGISFFQNIDWVVIATPDETHYEIIKDCLNLGVNVFCEKPVTLSYQASEELFELAEEKKLILYCSDIHNFRNYNFPIKEKNIIKRIKPGGGSLNKVLYRLVYHDIYILYEYLKTIDLTKIVILNKTNKLHFKIDDSFEFLYDVNTDKVEHSINGYSLFDEDDILTKMLLSVFEENVDFEYNKKITLFANRVIDLINEMAFPKIAVVGGGIFGCTAAWKLAKHGYDVTLYEKNNDIISSASYINQYRLHRGYHYPRSEETAEQSILGEQSFLNEYNQAVVNGEIDHYYCIANQGSLVDSDQYKSFLNKMNLYYEEKNVDLIQANKVSLTVKVNELLFNPERLKQICWNKLNQFNVKVKLNTQYTASNDRQVINATYANINHLMPKDKQKDYQFELCEKPVMKLPNEYRNKSIVIMDGPFMCIDPLGDTDYHVMGNVVHAIHSTNIGKFPKYNRKFKKLLNKGIIKNPEITNVDKFIESAKMFFVDIEKSEHIGSMFTIRTVLPNRDNDDARPTLVENVHGNIFNIFSGKIGTCVDAAKELMEYM